MNFEKTIFCERNLFEDLAQDTLEWKIRIYIADLNIYLVRDFDNDDDEKGK